MSFFCNFICITPIQKQITIPCKHQDAESQTGEIYHFAAWGAGRRTGSLFAVYASAIWDEKQQGKGRFDGHCNGRTGTC